MKKKIQKKQKNDESTFSSSEVMSLLEHMNEGIAVIAESQVGFSKRFDGIDDRLDGIDGRLDGIDDRLDGIDGRLDGIDGRLDGIDGRLDSLESKTDRIQEDVTDIKSQLSEKVDRSEFVKLEKRMVKLEQVVFSKGA